MLSGDEEATRSPGRSRPVRRPQSRQRPAQYALPEVTRHQMLYFAAHAHVEQEAAQMSAILLANGQALSVADMVGQDLGRGANRAQCMRHRQGHPHRRRRGRWPDPGTVRRGHPQAVVSLWPTIDLTTCLLMRRFYQRLADTSVAGALGRARSQLASLTLYQQAEELVVLQGELVKQE